MLRTIPKHLNAILQMIDGYVYPCDGYGFGIDIHGEHPGEAPKGAGHGENAGARAHVQHGGHGPQRRIPMKYGVFDGLEAQGGCVVLPRAEGAAGIQDKNLFPGFLVVFLPRGPDGQMRRGFEGMKILLPVLGPVFVFQGGLEQSGLAGLWKRPEPPDPECAECPMRRLWKAHAHWNTLLCGSGRRTLPGFRLRQDRDRTEERPERLPVLWEPEWRKTRHCFIGVPVFVNWMDSAVRLYSKKLDRVGSASV